MNRRKTALLVVDFQVGVVAECHDADRVATRIAILVDRARSAGSPVFWIRHTDEELVADTPPWEWHPALRAGAEEAEFRKTFNSAFDGTELPSALEDAPVESLVVVGAQSNWCIRSTCYGAIERGYETILVSDAHTTTPHPLDGGTTIEAASLIEHLNETFQWISTPGGKNKVLPSSEVIFANG